MVKTELEVIFSVSKKNLNCSAADLFIGTAREKSHAESVDEEI